MICLRRTKKQTKQEAIRERIQKKLILQFSKKNLTTFIKDEIEDFSQDDDDDDCNSEHKFV